MDEVIAVLGDMQRFAQVHPIIQRIDPLGDKGYLVHEKVRFGPIPYLFTYPVIVNMDRAAALVEATIQRMTRMTMEFKVEAEGEGSKVTGTV